MSQIVVVIIPLHLSKITNHLKDPIKNSDFVDLCITISACLKNVVYSKYQALRLLRNLF